MDVSLTSGRYFLKPETEKVDRKEIKLGWYGPNRIPAPNKKEGTFNPPKEPGVYLWTVAPTKNYRISYVGEASNVHDRMYQHFFWTLGGAYCLYSDDHLIHGNKPKPIYTPGMQNLLSLFVTEFKTKSKLALDNLLGYSFFWAATSSDRTLRQSIESALITRASSEEEPLQNVKVNFDQTNICKIEGCFRFSWRH